MQIMQVKHFQCVKLILGLVSWLHLAFNSYMTIVSVSDKANICQLQHAASAFSIAHLLSEIKFGGYCIVILMINGLWLIACASEENTSAVFKYVDSDFYGILNAYVCLVRILNISCTSVEKKD